MGLSKNDHIFLETFVMGSAFHRLDIIMVLVVIKRVFLNERINVFEGDRLEQQVMVNADVFIFSIVGDVRVNCVVFYSIFAIRMVLGLVYADFRFQADMDFLLVNLGLIDPDLVDLDLNDLGLDRTTKIV